MRQDNLVKYMQDCEYDEVHIADDEIENNKEKLSFTIFLRQLFICSGPWTAYMMLGLSMGAPTVLIPQIRREANSTEAVSDEMASWLSTVNGYSGIPWVIILAILARFIGRKIPTIIVGFTTLIGFTVFYCSTSMIQFIISEIILGVANGAMLTSSIMVLTEYTSPRYRGVFLTIKSASFVWGMWISNAIGTFFHWKIIGLFGILCSFYTLVSAAFWPESPYWLANMGRYENCARSHRWLKGNNVEAEKELEALIQFQSHIKEVESTNYTQMLKSKEYYMPIFCCLLVMSLYHFSGKLVCSVYAIQILKKITDNESAAYTGMLILDGITVLGTYIGCGLTKYLTRRLILITSSSIAVLFLLLLSLYLYLVNLSIILENSIASTLLLIGFSLGISCGPMIMSTTISGELMPLKLRSVSVSIVAVFTSLLMATMLKVSPYIFKCFSVHGAFLFYALSSSIFIILIYIYLPETKDKTLQEIEDFFNGNSNLNEKKHLMP